MSHSIYATFHTTADAERAAGALIDHGVSREDISFVVSERVLSPTVFHPETPGTGGTPAPVDTLPPVAHSLPGTFSAEPVVPHAPPAPPVPEFANPLEPQIQRLNDEERADLVPGYHYDALGAVLPDHPGLPAPQVSNTPSVPVLAANTPQEVVLNEPHAHIVDMEQERPAAAEGITTTTATDAAKGVFGGAGLGVGLGILLGIATIAIPGVGLVAGAGALIAGLAAATGAAGGIAGGVYGYLADLGMPADHARLISDHLETGGSLLNIHVSGRVAEEDIVRLLTKYGATSAQGF